MARDPASRPQEAAAAQAARRAARSRAVRLGLVGMGIVVGLAALVLAIILSRSTPSTAPLSQTIVVEAQGTAATSDMPSKEQLRDPLETAGQVLETPASTHSTDGPSGITRQVTVVDSAEVPWVSPTAGRPPALAYLPPGSQWIMLARPAEIMADDEGRQFVRSLGPRVADAITLLNTLCHTGIENIVELQVGWQAGSSETATAAGEAVAGWTVRFREPTPLWKDGVARGAAWGETKEQNVDGETIHVGTALSFWLPAAEEGRVLVMAPRGLLEKVVEAARLSGLGLSGIEDDGDTLVANLPQDLEHLVGMLDRTRHLTFLGFPHYLQHDGRSLLAGPLAGIVEPLGRFFGDGVKVAALSLHCADNFYAEVDAVAPRAEPAQQLAKRLAVQVTTMADAVEDACAAIQPHPYGRTLVMRLPAMIRALAANTRCGAEGKGVVLNAYLPRHAGHNLVLAAERALEQLPDSAFVPMDVATIPAAVPVESAAPLQKTISMVFAKDTLEKSIQMLSDEIGMPIEILGGDLQLEGITKNQSFGLDERSKTADAVLRTILARSDSAGRLVYVVRTKDGVESLEITTRAAAAKRGDTLPPGFE
jgi:hypothetical protein